MTDQIDFVVLWVDGTDLEEERRTAACTKFRDNGTDVTRFRDWGLMRWWFRGVEKFAPWVNRIFFVTNGQIPEWLNLENPKLKVVKHEDYIPEQYLPTFNSNVIELWLHRIPELGEQFVLFNDDMFLVAPVKPMDFFRDGLPCDTALMDLATAPGPEDCLPHILINNFALINRHFRKREVLRNNAGGFFSPKYGIDLLRNLLLAPFRYFSCFRDSHLPSSYRKSTFQKVWEEEGEMLETCGTNRFRSKSDFSHWLMKCWQICEGNFAVRGTRWGHHYELWEDPTERICRELEQQKYCAVCLNDSKEDIDFESIRQMLTESFGRILPERSEFEAF